MQTKEKRSTGRPKIQKETVVESATLEAPIKASTKKKRTIKRKEEVGRAAEYEITKGGGVVFMLPQKGVTIYDKENDTVREIRYCPNEPSIYVDEQSENAIKQSVIFELGRIFVPKEKPNLNKFLELHPANKINGGNIFKLVNKS